MRGLTRDRKKIDYKPIACSKCGLAGGTLVKVDDRYEHQDRAKCRMLQLRRK